MTQDSPQEWKYVKSNKNMGLHKTHIQIFIAPLLIIAPKIK